MASISINGGRKLRIAVLGSTYFIALGLTSTREEAAPAGVSAR